MTCAMTLGIIALLAALAFVAWSMVFSVEHDHYITLDCNEGTCLAPCQRCIRNCKTSHLAGKDCYKACGRFCMRPQEETQYLPPTPRPLNPGW